MDYRLSGVSTMQYNCDMVLMKSLPFAIAGVAIHISFRLLTCDISKESPLRRELKKKRTAIRSSEKACPRAQHGKLCVAFAMSCVVTNPEFICTVFPNAKNL